MRKSKETVLRSLVKTIQILSDSGVEAYGWSNDVARLKTRIGCNQTIRTHEKHDRLVDYFNAFRSIWAFGSARARTMAYELESEV